MIEIQAGTLTLTHKETVARDTVILRFSSDTELNFKPGQFVSMEFGPKAWRAYSIASHPDEAELELCVRLVEGGVASEIFRTADIGAEFNFKGPFGHFILSENADATLNFLCDWNGDCPAAGYDSRRTKTSQTTANATVLWWSK
jgi:ferredoxin-NADP reductase